MSDLNYLSSTTDATIWAKEFANVLCGLYDFEEVEAPDIEELAATWFANAFAAAESNQTAVQAVNQAITRARFYQTVSVNHPDVPGRDFAVAITKLEDASMWFTRGLAKYQGKFNPADLERGNDGR